MAMNQEFVGEQNRTEKFESSPCPRKVRTLIPTKVTVVACHQLPEGREVKKRFCSVTEWPRWNPFLGVQTVVHDEEIPGLLDQIGLE